MQHALISLAIPVAAAISGGTQGDRGMAVRGAADRPTTAFAGSGSAQEELSAALKMAGGKTIGVNGLSLNYLPGGLLSHIGDGSFEETYSYNARKQLTGIETRKGGNLVTSFGYDYDPYGNRLTEVYSNPYVSGELTQYGYDAADRLTGVLYPDGKAVLYSLRGDGSRLAEKHFEGMGPAIPLGPEAFNDTVGSPSKHITYGFDARDGLNAIQDLVSNGVGTVTQDAAGRMTAYAFDGVNRSMTWDAADRMVRIVQNGETSTYSYDWRNWRTQKVTPLETVNYTWGADDLVAEEATLAGETNPLPLRTYLQGPRMGLVLGTAEQSGTTPFAHDDLGSVMARVSPATTTLHRYDAWGDVTTTVGFNSPQAGENQVAYTGHNWDPESKFVYGKARYLAPKHGRWESSDPIVGAFLQGPMGSNAFLYARGGPTRFVDRNGMWSSVNIPGIAEPVHQMAIETVLGGIVPRQFLETLKARQVDMDSNQSDAYQYRHAMCGRTRPRAADIERAENFVREKMRKAIAARISGDDAVAYQALGDLLHTLQDATSPTHSGFQLWTGQILDRAHDPWRHFSFENYYPYANNKQALEYVTYWTWAIFVGAAPMPDRFFVTGTGQLNLPAMYPSSF